MLPPLRNTTPVASAAGIRLHEGRCLAVAALDASDAAELHLLLRAAREANADAVRVSLPSDPALRWADLAGECGALGIPLLPSITSLEEARSVRAAGLRWVKIGSSFASNRPLLREAAALFDALIVSIGGLDDVEVEKTASVLRHEEKPFALLHREPSSGAPAALDRRRMEWLRGLAPEIGIADHTADLAVAEGASAWGARFFEKHLSTTATADRPHAADPTRFRALAKVLAQHSYGRRRRETPGGASDGPVSD